MKPLAATDPASIGPYRLLGVLGRGGMGRVYLGESLTGRRVAIKVIRADLAEDPEFRRRFEREVTAARTVNPLYTAPVVDADTAATAPWFATAYIDGPSLSARVASDGPLGSGATLTLAAGLAEALASMHEAGLVHRDITPGNIILNDSGPHIIDFGIALTPHTTKLTAGQTMGTPSYIAPEVIQGGPAGPASDVFSLGATLVFAATGRHLITDGPLAAQVLQITRGEFDLAAVPKQLRSLIVWCLSVRPEQRPTAAELARIVVGSGVAKPGPRWYASTDPAPPVALPASRRFSRRHVLLGAGIAGLAALGAGAAAVAGAFGAGRRTPAASTSAPPGRSASATTAPPSLLAGDRPGRVVWEARSGVTPLGPSPSGLQSPIRVVVDLDGRQLIGASGSRVFAVGLDGVERWSHTLPTGLVNLWPWGDAVLVSDYRRLWLVNARTGGEEFVVDAADREEVDSRGDNPDGHPIQIGGVALSDELTFVGLGTATIALERSGARRWRRSRPDARNGVRPPAGVPLAYGDGWLVTHDPAGSLVELGLRNADSGALRWLVQYEPAAAPNLPPPGPPGSRPGPKVDEAWHRSEGRVGTDLILVREVQEVRVVSLANGTRVWEQSSQTPIAAIELMGDQVLIGADRVRAYAFRTGAARWEADLRGARMAALPDGKAVFVASEYGLSSLDDNGQVLWHADYPRSVSNAVADRVTVAGNLGLVTFRPRDERLEPLDVDVLAIALASP
ncbi:MAG TPA: serine/threonine-protein kinase [Micromonosporaceae bacterium]|nr:serine/threonine-protein kinase [Micromonosporaceae bacterium]